MQALPLLAAGLAWFGATLTTLAEGRRGLALGLVLTGAGLGGIQLSSGRPLNALVLVAAALLSAALRLRDGASGWGLLPPGSTPSIVLGIAVLVACVLMAGALLQGAAGIASLAPLAVALVAAGRLLTVVRRQPSLAAASVLALALAGFGTLAATVAGGLAALALAAFPAGEAEEAAR
jgi:hypothetical protein